MLKKLFGFMYAVAGLYWCFIEADGYECIGIIRGWNLSKRITGAFGLLLGLAIWPIGLLHYLISKCMDWADKHLKEL